MKGDAINMKIVLNTVINGRRKVIAKYTEEEKSIIKTKNEELKKKRVN